jgi:large subunit ribosomal protein L17
MRHRKKGKTLGRPKASRDAMLRHVITSVILYEKVKTTKAKASAARPLIERAITKGKNPNLANRRSLIKLFYTDHPVKKIIEVLSPRYMSRAGGYTRITKLLPRKNDGAEMVKIELV